MKKYHLIICSAVVLLTVFQGCKNKDRSIMRKSFVNTDTIKQTGVVHFDLDSLTSNLLSCVQFVKGDSAGADKLVYLNEETGSIYINDVSSKKIIKEIKPEFKPEQLKKKFQGCYYHNADSVFLFAYYPKVYLLNGDGKVIKTYAINIPFGNMSENQICRAMDIETKHLPFFWKNKLYISALLVGDLSKNETRKNQIILDVTSGKVELGTPSFPKEYHSKLGGGHYLFYYTTLKADEGKIVFSYPASHDLYVENITDGSIKAYEANSHYFDNIEEYNESRYKSAPSAEAEYFMTNYSYGPTLYDQFRDVYYRITFLPVQETNAIYEAKDAPTKRVSIMVLDGNFKYLGERLLEKNSYWPNSVFVSREGLNIQNKTHGDATLDFTVFSPEKK